MSVVKVPLSPEQFVERASILVKNRLTPVAEKIKNEIPNQKFILASRWFIFLAFLLSLLIVGIPILFWAIWTRWKLHKEFEQRFEQPIAEIYADVIKECGLAVVNNSFTNDSNNKIDRYIKNFSLEPKDLTVWSKLFHYQLADGTSIKISSSTYFSNDKDNRNTTLGLISFTLNDKSDQTYKFSLFKNVLKEDYGVKKIKLENNEFNRKIGIWSNDPLKARMTATPFSMETFLNHYQQNIKNNWVAVVRENQYLEIVFIPTNDGVLFFDYPLINDVDKIVQIGYQDIINDLYEIYALLSLARIPAYV